MDDYKEDLSVIRTRTLLCKSLFALLEKMPFEKITVMDICHEAMVHRATFYNHFEDKEHLLEYAIDEIKEDLFNATIGGEKFASPKEMYLSLISRVTDFIDEYRDKLLLIIKNNNYEQVFGLILTTVRRSIRYLTSKNEYKMQYKLPASVMIDFLSGGITSMGLSWLQSTSPCSKEELIHYFDLLLNDKIYVDSPSNKY